MSWGTEDELRELKADVRKIALELDDDPYSSSEPTRRRLLELVGETEDEEDN